uniref:Uncharacterized protein n=1 Tax=Steinernema glaseri TaxID=37863 RepID=A0A1I8ASY0_9BILA
MPASGPALIHLELSSPCSGNGVSRFGSHHKSAQPCLSSPPSELVLPTDFVFFSTGRRAKGPSALCFRVRTASRFGGGGTVYSDGDSPPSTLPRPTAEAAKPFEVCALSR